MKRPAAFAALRQARGTVLPKLPLRGRKRAITAILEARFSVRALQHIRRANAAYWISPRNDMARGIYGEAMREKQRLAKVPDAQLVVEAAAIGFLTLDGREKGAAAITVS
jgi:hypothetical protein